MTDEHGTLPIDYELFKKLDNKTQDKIMDEVMQAYKQLSGKPIFLETPSLDKISLFWTLPKIESELKNRIIDLYAPPSTRWNRNHTARAEWHFIWSLEK